MKEQTSLKNGSKFLNWSIVVFSIIVYMLLLFFEGESEAAIFAATAIFWYLFRWNVVKKRWDTEADSFQYILEVEAYEAAEKSSNEDVPEPERDH